MNYCFVLALLFPSAVAVNGGLEAGVGSSIHHKAGRPVHHNKHSKKVIGYFDAQAQKSLPLSDVPFDDLSHVVLVNAVKVDSNGTLHLRPKHLLGEAGAEQLIRRLAAQKGPSVIVSLRGYPDDVSLDELSETDENRLQFVNNLAQQLADWGANGLELEWHSDDLQSGKPITAPFDDQERSHMAMLCRDLSTSLRPHGLSLSVAVRPGRKEFSVADVVNKFVDWLSVRAYSMRSLGDPHHSSLKDAQTALDEWRVLGVDPMRLVLATPFFARPGAALRMHGRDATLREPWHELVNTTGFYVPPGSDAHGDIFLDAGEGKAWWASGFNTTRAKVKHVVNGGYGGIAVRDLHHDAQGENSLLQLVVKELSKHEAASMHEATKAAVGVSLMQSKFSLSRKRPRDEI